MALALLPIMDKILKFIATSSSNIFMLSRNVANSFLYCKDFDSFISAMIAPGCEVKRGKNLAFKIPDRQKFIRCKSLGADYTENAIRERISGRRIVAPKPKVVAPVDNKYKLNMLIDIQAKLQQAKSPGFEHWARIYNLKESAKTLIFLQERGLTEYIKLVEKTEAASKDFHVNNERRNVIIAFPLSERGHFVQLEQIRLW